MVVASAPRTPPTTPLFFGPCAGDTTAKNRLSHCYSDSSKVQWLFSRNQHFWWEYTVSQSFFLCFLVYLPQTTQKDFRLPLLEPASYFLFNILAFSDAFHRLHNFSEIQRFSVSASFSHFSSWRILSTFIQPESRTFSLVPVALLPVIVAWCLRSTTTHLILTIEQKVFLARTNFPLGTRCQKLLDVLFDFYLIDELWLSRSRSRSCDLAPVARSCDRRFLISLRLNANVPKI